MEVGISKFISKEGKVKEVGKIQLFLAKYFLLVNLYISNLKE